MESCVSSGDLRPLGALLKIYFYGYGALLEVIVQLLDDAIGKCGGFEFVGAEGCALGNMARGAVNYAPHSVVLCREAFVERITIVEDGNINEVQVLAKQECVDRWSFCVHMNASINGVDVGEALHRGLLGVGAGCQRCGHNC